MNRWMNNQQKHNNTNHTKWTSLFSNEIVDRQCAKLQKMFGLSTSNSIVDLDSNFAQCKYLHVDRAIRRHGFKLTLGICWVVFFSLAKKNQKNKRWWRKWIGIERHHAEVNEWFSLISFFDKFSVWSDLIVDGKEFRLLIGNAPHGVRNTFGIHKFVWIVHISKWTPKQTAFDESSEQWTVKISHFAHQFQMLF